MAEKGISIPFPGSFKTAGRFCDAAMLMAADTYIPRAAEYDAWRE